MKAQCVTASDLLQWEMLAQPIDEFASQASLMSGTSDLQLGSNASKSWIRNREKEGSFKLLEVEPSLSLSGDADVEKGVADAHQAIGPCKMGANARKGWLRNREREASFKLLEMTRRLSLSADVGDAATKSSVSEPHQSLVDGHNSAIHMSRRSCSTMTNERKKEMEMRLFCMTALGDLSGMKKLVESGVDIDAKDYNGRTALHLAAQRGHLDAVEYLVSVGANIDCADDRGETPLSLSKHGNHIAVQTALHRAGAKAGLETLDFLEAKRSKLARFAIMEAFPRPIARAILEGRRIDQIAKGMVSLFFSDIVGFTSMSSNMDAGKVSQMLNTLFRKFDKHAHHHGVQKVDVIGDAYVAATNFMEDQPHDHAARLARFAIDVMRAARETSIDEDNPEVQGSVQIRVGLHCGPVSGNVVGWQNFKYTLMGDTVNTASRMESTGVAGRIQCSDAMAGLIAQQAHEMILKPREGGVDVKGKGHLQTYWLSSLREGLRNFSSCPHLLSQSPGRHSDRRASCFAHHRPDDPDAAEAAEAATARPDTPRRGEQEPAGCRAEDDPDPAAGGRCGPGGPAPAHDHGGAGAERRAPPPLRKAVSLNGRGAGGRPPAGLPGWAPAARGALRPPAQNWATRSLGSLPLPP